MLSKFSNSQFQSYNNNFTQVINYYKNFTYILARISHSNAEVQYRNKENCFPNHASSSRSSNQYFNWHQIFDNFFLTWFS